MEGLPRQILLSMVVAASCSVGCVRWFEAYPDDRDDNKPRADSVGLDGVGLDTDPVGPDAVIPPPKTLNHAHDTCGTAMVVDVTTVPASGLTLDLDTSKAIRDYAGICKHSHPEVVLKLTKLSPGTKIALRCALGGTIHFAWLGAMCPQSAEYCHSGSCTGPSSTSASASAKYVMIARPENEPPAKLTLTVSW